MKTMKKAVILAMFAISLASCKKTYVCDCTVPTTEPNALNYGEVEQDRIPKNQVEYSRINCESQGCLFYAK